MGNSSFTLSLNAFADLTHQEFKASFLGFSAASIDHDRRRNASVQSPGNLRDVPASIDWRKKGAVTEVKDQASCGMFIELSFIDYLVLCFHYRYLTD